MNERCHERPAPPRHRWCRRGPLPRCSALAARQRGFTLIELMVVVTILGLLAAAVSVYMRPQRTVIDAANVTADVVREAARIAFAKGPVRADVVNALGYSYRTKMNVESEALVLRQLVENVAPGSASWVEIRRVALVAVDRQVVLTGWKPIAQVNDGTFASPPAVATDFSGLELHCWADGHCDAGTIYFAGPNGTAARTVILPLGGAVLARRGL
jgi:prepilin-type N-terminal cleavage/methylation domain-containing protein